MANNKEPQMMINKKLFGYLVRYHLMDIKDDPIANEYIAAELEAKLKKAAAHESYTKQILENKEI